MTTAMPTIAERHNLQPGDLCEIAVINGVTQETYHRYGKYKYTAAYDGTMHFQDGSTRGWFAISEERVRSVRKVTREHVASQFKVDQRVRVAKYGGTYHGTVTKVGRTRLTVRFITLGGKTKEQAFPAWEVELVSKTDWFDGE